MAVIRASVYVYEIYLYRGEIFDGIRAFLDEGGGSPAVPDP